MTSHSPLHVGAGKRGRVVGESPARCRTLCPAHSHSQTGGGRYVGICCRHRLCIGRNRVEERGDRDRGRSRRDDGRRGGDGEREQPGVHPLQGTQGGPQGSPLEHTNMQAREKAYVLCCPTDDIHTLGRLTTRIHTATIFTFLYGRYQVSHMKAKRG